MTFIIGMISQKGGAGKSTLARLFARELAVGGYSVKIADLDPQQKTSVLWAADRAENNVEPDIRAEVYRNVKTALKNAEDFDAYILDGKPHASVETLEVAKVSDLVIIPTGQTKDDLRPAVELANDLANQGIPEKRIAFVLVKTTSDAEAAAALDYLSKTDYTVLPSYLPVSTAYGKAHDIGKAVSETSFKTLNAKAESLAQSIINRLAAVAERKVA